MIFHRAWTFADKRSGRRATAKSWPSSDEADTALRTLRNTSRGDDRRLSRHLEVVELNPNTWGSAPGDIIKSIED